MTDHEEVMQIRYQDFYDEYGESPDSSEPAQYEVIEAYRHKVPDELVRHWEKYGWCSYGEGLLWIVNPSLYEDTLQEWLEGTPYEDRKDLSVVARSAFGELFIWAKGKGDILKIRPIHGTITYFPNTERKTRNTQDEDEAFVQLISFADKESLDTKDDSNKPMFDRAQKKFGRLESDEVYGLKLPTMLGGSVSISNMGKMEITSYLSIVRGWDEPKLVIIDTENQSISYS